MNSYWYCVTMDDLYRKDKSLNIVTLQFFRDLYKVLPDGKTKSASAEQKRKAGGIGVYEVDLDFDYMKIDYDYEGFEHELSKDLQRAHNKLCGTLQRLPSSDELKAEVERNLYNWYRK